MEFSFIPESRYFQHFYVVEKMLKKNNFISNTYEKLYAMYDARKTCIL